MIVDTSAIIAILGDDPEAAGLAALVEAAGDVRVSAATVLEASLVCGPTRQVDLDAFLAEVDAQVVPFDDAQLAVARSAHLRFGRRSGSPARLSFGDCLSYALAIHADDELLFIATTSRTPTCARPADVSSERDGSVGVEVGRHRAVQAPGDGDGTVTGVAAVMRRTEERVWLGAEFAGLLTTDEEQGRAASVAIAPPGR